MGGAVGGAGKGEEKETEDGKQNIMRKGENNMGRREKGINNLGYVIKMKEENIIFGKKKEKKESRSYDSEIFRRV